MFELKRHKWGGGKSTQDTGEGGGRGGGREQGGEGGGGGGPRLCPAVPTPHASCGRRDHRAALQRRREDTTGAEQGMGQGSGRGQSRAGPKGRGGLPPLAL